MCFSILPRCGIHVLASSWFKSFHNLSRTCGNGARFGVFGSSTYGHEGGHSRRWSRKPITTKTEGRKINVLTSKTSDLVQEISDVSITTSSTLNISKPEISEYQRTQYCDTQQKIDEFRDLIGLITVFVFDIETTGISRQNERIIEIALQDLLGGENSTFQTLVNPERDVWNECIHNISTHMVRKPGVPRMKDLIPILLQYVESRRKPGGPVLWIAHNARRFDVPFLISEFRRCSFDIPSDWRFMDSVPLAREAMKSGGSKGSSVSLEALRKHYKIPLVGPPHRAMSDVNTLSLILRRLTFDLKLPVSGLVERSFTASDLINVKKKKSSS
ncbi:polynucleotidyl transferase, ribonuclease H-like superfamily protein [Actinidia rufa]|uniref:Polynucleotidyl transferase, ribonuclease H-like superfamily protein n=1 Tax=Actinidia rufa TaxID=165716 RepID=A0A7J0ERA7_9ERIC|nr:polynucleotidyl transferase, ribonuclease H-like superfamily protein [Actinidia rufa]